MKLCDERTKRFLMDDKKVISDAKVCNIFSYYKQFATSENVILIALSILSAVIFGVIRGIVTAGSSSNLLNCLYLSSYGMLIVTPALTVIQIIASGYKPYLVRHFAVMSLKKDVMQAYRYEDVCELLNDFNESNLCILTKNSRKDIQQLKTWCAEEVFVNRASTNEIRDIKTNSKNVKVKFDTDFVIVPVVKRVHGEEPAVILTDAGVVLQFAA